MQLSIVSLAPTTHATAGIQQGLTPGFTEYCVPADPGPTVYPGLMWGDISVKRAGNLLPLDVHMCQGSDQRCPGLLDGDLPRDLQEKCPLQSWAVPRAVPWTSQSTKLNPRASPRYPRVVGAGLQLIAAYTGKLGHKNVCSRMTEQQINWNMLIMLVVC